ncbi:uncharacterized protein BJ171DRAFT_581925 [Polychytrium aggregatum]|uniref:uncharacterized protein n=1 Tax=Polychytrium aggregatum TaxID=110093 RepID=UPI0022FE0DC4|nr:uncharacterized protein BJ171DRAFT_581925 [Polychytrium aggregatum]KAI9204346.1 hypothetical protein BJ171DRAFT_581925 [Polychytrium aggregatum]
MKFPPCTVCRSVRYRRNDSGGYNCINGHELQHYREEVEDDEAHIGHLRTRLTRKRAPPPDSEEDRASDYDALDHYVIPYSIRAELYQLLLRAQIEALTKHLSLQNHGEIESTALELWMLYITRSNINLDDRLKGRAHRSRKVAQDSTSMWAKNTEISDQTRLPGSMRHHSSIKFKLNYHVTLVVCYVACLIHRVPVMVGDLLRWASNEVIPYSLKSIDLPVELKTIAGIDIFPIPPLYPDRFLKFAQTCIEMYISDFLVLLPCPNWPLLWVRILKETRLPLAIYAIADQFNNIVNNFRVPRDYKAHSQITMIVPIVATVRMIYGLDGISRKEPPESHLNIAARLMPLDEWLRFMVDKFGSDTGYMSWNFSNKGRPLSGHQVVEYSKFVSRITTARGNPNIHDIIATALKQPSGRADTGLSQRQVQTMRDGDAVPAHLAASQQELVPSEEAGHDDGDGDNDDDNDDNNNNNNDDLQLAYGDHMRIFYSTRRNRSASYYLSASQMPVHHHQYAIVLDCFSRIVGCIIEDLEEQVSKFVVTLDALTP